MRRQEGILFLSAHNDMALRLLSHVNARDFVGLVLVDVFEGEKGLLADQGHLFVGPDLGRVVLLLLNFLL